MGDSDLSIKDYWEKHRDAIAKIRKWRRPSETTSFYNNIMNNLAATSPNIITKKPIGQLIFSDIFTAVTHVYAEKDLAANTVSGYWSLIRDIFTYADMNMHTMNIMTTYTNNVIKRAMDPKLDYNTETKAGKRARQVFGGSAASVTDRLREDIERKRNARKSLSIAQMQSLMKHISAHLTEDGRYMALAIMIYTGLRPEECRALRWEDVKKIVGKSGRSLASYFEIRHVLDRSNKDIEYPKTANGFRNVPIHCELNGLLAKWEKHIRTVKQIHAVPSKKGSPPAIPNLSGYICCTENRFGEPCSYQSLARFADKNVFPRLDKELSEALSAEMALSELSNDKTFAPDDTLSLYVLRHNFWTWLQYGTLCTKNEKLYVMGHSMKNTGKNLRPLFSEPSALLNIKTKMDAFMILREFQSATLLLDPFDVDSDLSNIGIHDIGLGGAYLRDGQALIINVQTLEENDHITLELRSSIIGKHRMSGTVNLFDIPASISGQEGMILQTQIADAIEGTKKRSRKPKA